MKHQFNWWLLLDLELRITNLLNKLIIYRWLTLAFGNKIGKWKAGVEAESKKLCNFIQNKFFVFVLILKLNFG